jgi:lipopolysaccharide/colanic/teichoic acid biosynthesis glycosyltransferase
MRTVVISSVQPIFLVRALRRIRDGVTALVMLTLLAPVLAALAVAIRMGTGESALYRHARLDASGRPFALYRLRTMTEERDDKGRLLPDHKRATPLGRWLYATRLYRAPSLWNVVRGDIEAV